MVTLLLLLLLLMLFLRLPRHSADHDARRHLDDGRGRRGADVSDRGATAVAAATAANVDIKVNAVSQF